MEEHGVVASGSWFPSHEQLLAADWKSPFTWQSDHEDYLLLNSAPDSSRDLRQDDYAPVKLKRGAYLVEFAFIESTSLGCFTRLTYRAAESAA